MHERRTFARLSPHVEQAMHASRFEARAEKVRFRAHGAQIVSFRFAQDFATPKPRGHCRGRFKSQLLIWKEIHRGENLSSSFSCKFLVLRGRRKESAQKRKQAGPFPPSGNQINLIYRRGPLSRFCWRRSSAPPTRVFSSSRSALFGVRAFATRFDTTGGGRESDSGRFVARGLTNSTAFATAIQFKHVYKSTDLRLNFIREAHKILFSASMNHRLNSQQLKSPRILQARIRRLE